MKLKLLIKSRKEESSGKLVELNLEEITVGRKDADITLADKKSSVKHAVFFQTPNRELALQDLQSTNGTFVNEKRVEKATLRVGDKVRIGDSLLFILNFVGHARPATKPEPGEIVHD